ncbi:alpha-amylase family glycosyl hydrolase [Paraglaciecola sp.]|uniref:alpha-amylase family glycosyl hydrolase n=1 Tax=Paraglaciecola sp. TaxID=1920173 RepID=UPI003EF5989A
MNLSSTGSLSGQDRLFSEGLMMRFLTVLACLVFWCAGSLFGAIANAGVNKNKEALLLHVPSPDWRDQIVYFLMIDRFADGDPTNNDQGANVYDPAKESHYSGGDLKGVVQQLDYIQNLGATAVWTTPHVAHQWWDPLVNYTGYHGYWARNFKQVDEHYGELNDYQTLSSELHKRDMYLIQDVVVNHTGNYFSYPDDYDASNVQRHVQRNKNSLPTTAPTQFPFSQNDPTNPAHLSANIFNWTPDIADFSDPRQETTFQTAGLDDLNTQNPVVRDALKESFGFWIKQAGVDAVRIDTAKYVEKKFYEDFLHGPNGLNQIAKSTGRKDFLSFGEIFNTSNPLKDNGEMKLKEYVSNAHQKRLSSAIGFPLYKEISRVFAGGAPTAYLSYRLNAQMQHFSNPYLVSNFIDNHDVERFLASGNIDGFKQAYALMMTVPGIPTIYQGDEQSFRHSRQAMFAGGYLTDVDQFNQQSEMYKFIQKMANIRKAHKVFSRGSLQIIQDNSAGAGVLVYRREYQGKSAYVLFNTAKQPVLLNGLTTEYVNYDGSHSAQLLLSHNLPNGLNVDENGQVTTVLPAQSFAIFGGDSGKPIKSNQEGSDFSVNDLQPEYLDQSEAFITGTSRFKSAQLLRVIDGKVGQAKTFNTDSNGGWKVEIPVSDLGKHKRTIELYSEKHNKASTLLSYISQFSNIQDSGERLDPKGDDHGLSGRYTRPLEQSFGCQMDMLKAEAKAAGSVLEIALDMCDVSTLWSPANGFDHVSFNIFFSLNAKQKLGLHGKANGAKQALPIIGGVFPDNKKWDLAHVAFGWGNYLYLSTNADVNQEGDKPGLAPDIRVDKKNNRIHFTYLGNNLGINDWSKVSIYITTWDKSGEGNYRDLSPSNDIWSFGGATSTAPKILDDLMIQLQPVKE